MARNAALCLLLAAFVALAAAPSSSAAPCFHGKRLTSAPITLKAAKKSSNNGATSAHSSFDGVSEPVRESGYFKVSSKKEKEKGKRKRKTKREKKTKKHEIIHSSVLSFASVVSPRNLPTNTTTKKKTPRNNSSTAPTTPTCSTCTSSPARPTRPPPTRWSSG